MGNTSMMALGFVLVGSYLSVSLWENPLGGRFIRQRQGGIFHRLLAALWRSFVVASAWWHQRVCMGLVDYDTVWHFVDRFWPSHGQRVAHFVTIKLVPLLLLDWLAWPIAKDYLQNKWRAEDEIQNRLYALQKSRKEVNTK